MPMAPLNSHFRLDFQISSVCLLLDTLNMFFTKTIVLIKLIAVFFLKSRNLNEAYSDAAQFANSVTNFKQAIGQNTTATKQLFSRKTRHKVNHRGLICTILRKKKKFPSYHRLTNQRGNCERVTLQEAKLSHCFLVGRKRLEALIGAHGNWTICN